MRSLPELIVCNIDTSTKPEEHCAVCILTRSDEVNMLNQSLDVLLCGLTNI